MKNRKRVLATACALCMLVAMLAPLTGIERVEAADIEEDLLSPLLMRSYVQQEYEGGTLYVHPDWTCLYYIPHHTDENTAFMLYYCGGGEGEDYIYYSGLYHYFEDYQPNCIMVFTRESGYNWMYEKNRIMFNVLRHLAYDTGTTISRLSVTGSSAGCYTAMKAAAQYYTEYGIPVYSVCTFDTGLYWQDPQHNLTAEECQTIADAGTMMFLFEEKDVTDSVPAIRQMIEYGVKTCIVGCEHENHSVISQNAYVYGLFSWSVGDDMTLPTEEYTMKWYDNHTYLNGIE